MGLNTERRIQQLDQYLMDHFRGNCFTLRDWQRHFGFRLEDEDHLLRLEAIDLKVIPARDTFGYWSIGAVDDQPLSIMAWHRICEARGLPGFYHVPPWYDNYPFANTSIGVGLCAMPIGPDAKTFDLPWREQVNSLAPQTIAVPAVHVVTWHILYQVKTGRFATPNHWLRCTDQYLPDSRVLVGQFGPHGLGITGHVFTKSHPRVALATGWIA